MLGCGECVSRQHAYVISPCFREFISATEELLCSSFSICSLFTACIQWRPSEPRTVRTPFADCSLLSLIVGVLIIDEEYNT